MIQDYNKISPTAVLVASLRARFTDMPYAQEIYAAIRGITKPQFFRRVPSLVAGLARFAPRSLSRVAFLESRYLIVNEALKSLGDSYAVIEIASGLSARGLEWSQYNSIYIETDLPDMLGIKQRVFHQVLNATGQAQSPNHHFYPLNALNYNEWERLGQKFFNEKKNNIAIVHEGLASYLSREEKDKLRDNIARFLSSFSAGGVWITPDFYPYEKRRRTWILKIIDGRIEKKTQRKYDHFAGQQDVMEYLTRAGFQAGFIDSSGVCDQLTCIARMHLDKEKIKKAMRRYKLWIARYNRN